ncbi:MAG: flagellar motor switch protein FliN [Syntrophales bacterium]|jgi:flagellar motor switch protein FliN/FliY|nr:flagellar motor switch protein FliN [Syntrophales bacterium]MDY0043112.1 flagellar motor switch protein FliN [Syntrophales bacterium]
MDQDENIGWDEAMSEVKNSNGQREVHNVTFDEIEHSTPSKGGLNLDFILEIPLKVSAELGRCRMLVNDLLQLGQGSVIELDKMAGEPMDIFVNNRLIARGEVVVANERFGVRLTDVVSPAERINNLK